jgi:hypothetical protein
MDEGLLIWAAGGAGGGTIRALKLYEAHGLLKPLRTAPTRQGARLPPPPPLPPPSPGVNLVV